MTRLTCLTVNLLGLLLALAPVADAAKLTNVAVYPDSVNLHTQRDRQSLVVQASFDNGITLDVTDKARYAFENAKLVDFQDATVYPKADGETMLTIAYEGHKMQIPVTVKDADKDRPISFKLDVMPVFMKASCNTGSCHGAARGKDGFNLSLFGFDPVGDHFRLTREMNGRRINLALPEESLLLLKSIGEVNHTGGKLFEKGSEPYNTMLRWLQAGAPLDGEDIAKPVGIEVLPKKIVLEGEGATQKLTVRASYSDGTDRDVTSLAAFITSNATSADVSDSGVIKAAQRGEAFVMARFETFTVGVDVIVIPKGVKYEWPGVPENNYIDTLVFDKLKKLRMTPSGLCSDEAFLRRAYLDITGTLPDREAYEAFMADTSDNKREKLVDELLERKEFSEIWVMNFAELLQIKSDGNRRMSYKATLLYYNWLQEKFASNAPMDQIVRELLSATGGTFTNPATNYYQVETNTLKTSENVAQVFMGMRTQCAQCHNHPFDRWTMDDYYSFAAFFSQIGRKGAEDPREQVIYNRRSGDVRHLVDNRVMTPKFLGGAVPEISRSEDRRAVLAKWLASPENPFFARNLANRVWAHFFGQGIIDPVDDVRVSNPPSNPELLDELAKRFTEYNYDFKKLVRDICTSRVYQLDTRPNDSNKLDTRNFTRGPIRRIRAEVMLDVISQVTETKNKFRGLPLGARAVQIADGNVTNYFLTTFGRATRETVCSCEVNMEPSLSQALHLLNGNTVNNKINQGKVVKKLLDQEMTPEQVVEDLYIRTLVRRPTKSELEKLSGALNTAEDKEQVLEDVFWALMNSKEFIFNH